MTELPLKRLLAEMTRGQVSGEALRRLGCS